ncbi:hypothetical protein KAM385_46500 [Aeromonas hydrophila]|nr:hypothetical protein KAM385_46500 [Aeromonas hydrophila]
MGLDGFGGSGCLPPTSCAEPIVMGNIHDQHMSVIGFGNLPEQVSPLVGTSAYDLHAEITIKNRIIYLTV